MFNNLKLAENKSKKYSLLAIILALIISGCLAVSTQDALAAYGVNPKIKQVKIKDNPAIYYLDHKRGLKKAYVSPKAFLTYGNKWSDVEIVGNAELNKWPEVKLVKEKNSPAVYYISKGQKALIKSEQQFIDAGFKWPDIVIIAPADLAEYKVVAFKAGGGLGNYGDSQVVVGLDAANPKADYFAMNTRDNLAAVFSLRALTRPVEIRKLVLDLAGVFNENVIKEIYLTNENDSQYSFSVEPHNRQAVFNFNNQPITLEPNEIKKIKVYLNFNDSSLNLINHAFKVVIKEPSSLGGVKAEGIFPLGGETFKLIAAGSYLEKVSASKEALNIDNNRLIIGSTENKIAKFNLAETSGRADVFIKELRFVNRGTGAGLNNFKLKNKAGQIVALAPVLVGDGELIFKLNNYKLNKAGSETFTVLADAVSGGNSTINFYLDRAKVMSSQGNFTLPVEIANLDEIIILKRQAIGVVAFELKPNNKVFAHQSGVIIGNFQVRNNNQRINLNSFVFSLEKSGSAPALTETAYLVNYNTGEVYGYFNGGQFNGGAVSVDMGGLTLTAKENLNVALVVKLPANISNGGFYQVIFDRLSYRTDSGVFLADAVDTVGARLTISQANLFLYPNNSLGEQNFIKGQKNIKIASFIMEAAAGSDARITELTFSRGRGSSGLVSFDNGFSNLRFFIGSSEIKKIQNPYAGDLAIGSFSFVLTAGTRAEIKIQADTETDLKVSEIQLAISSLTAVDNNSFIPATVNNLNAASHKTTFGQVRAEVSKVAAGFVTKGEDDNVIAGFKVKNTGAEDIRLDSITVNATDQQITNSLGYSDLRVVERLEQRSAGRTIGRPVAGANKIDLGGFIVKAGQETVFDVHLKASTDIAGGNINIFFSDFAARGKDSGVKVIVNGDPTDSFSFTTASGSKGGASNDNGGNTKIFTRPVSGSITYGWHAPDYPFRDALGEHTGLDIAVAQGTRVKAAAQGTVMEVINGTGDQASYIAISHGSGFLTRYAHLSRLDVKVGDKVKQGDIVGLSGGTPGTPGAGLYSNGAHLHFEILIDGASVDPEKYL